jgi:tRNA pseudouridine38-40 synthase
MPCFRMTLAYDGTAYAGWQVQPGLPTIQGALEDALQRIVGARVRVVASGRTDAGVHALAQVAGFRCETRLTPDTLRRAINANTPDDIYVSELCAAPDDFHAIRDAVAKRYRYVIQDGPQRDVFARSTAWQLPGVLDVPPMQAGARYLVGQHDFRSFETAGAPRRSSVRTVHALDVHRLDHHYLQPLAIEVEADGFLYNMVRNIVGSLVLVGRGEQPPDWIARVLAARDRTQAGPTAPALGLTLVNVQYGGAECASPTS